MPEVMRDPFEKPVTGNENEPQGNSSHAVTKLLEELEDSCQSQIFCHQTNVRVEMCSKTFLCQFSQKDEERCSFHVSNQYCSEAN